jgi:hypothetical protein
MRSWPSVELSSEAIRTRLFVGSCALLALLLGLHGLADKGLGLDEAASAGFALHSARTWFADNNMALYYALLAGWVRCFGYGEFALRSLSVLCFVASVPAMYALASTLFDVGTARVATLLYVTNPMLVQFAQEARGYMLEVLLLIVAGWALLAQLARPSALRALLHGATLGLALYAHLFAAWLGLVHSLFVLSVWRRPGTPRLQLAAALALSAVFALPLFLQALGSGGEQIGWIYPPSLPAVWRSCELFSGGRWLAVGELACIGAFALGTAHGAPLTRRWVWGWLLVPLLGSWLFSLCLQPIAHPKYLIIVLPAWVLAVSGGLARIASRQLRSLALCVLLLMAAVRLQVWYAELQKERWREVVELLATRWQPGDAIVLDVLGSESFDYYVERLGQSRRWPAALFPSRAWGFPGPEAEPQDPLALSARLRAAQRIWLVRNRAPLSAAELPVAKFHRLIWQRELEPHDEDDRSLFANSHGRLISLQLYAAEP